MIRPDPGTLLAHTLRQRRRRRLIIAGAVLALSSTLTGCAAAVHSAPLSRATESPTAEQSSPPSLPPEPDSSDGNAELQRFDAVNRATIAAHSDPHGRDFIDALAAAGFNKSAMQLTADSTSIGLRAPSIIFSVRDQQSCLIGQWGPAGTYTSTVSAPLTDGGCLIGATSRIP